MKGVIKSEVKAIKTLFTLKLPAQGRIGRETIRPSEVQILAFTETHDGERGIVNAFDLLDVLFERGVTDRYVLELALAATGHPVVQSPDPQLDAPDKATSETRDHEQ